MVKCDGQSIYHKFAIYLSNSVSVMDLGMGGKHERTYKAF